MEFAKEENQLQAFSEIDYYQEPVAEESPVSSAEIPVYSSAILGWRIFETDWNQLVIYSPHQKDVWDQSLKSAECNATIPCSPNEELKEYCDCGLYAYHNFWFQNVIQTEYSQERGQIGAAIAGKGKTFIHNDGFRSQEMQILCLFSNKRTEKENQLISEKLAVPVFQSAEKFQAYAKAGASPLDKSKIPDNPQLSLF